MIQDIAPHKLYNQFDSKAVPADSDLVLAFNRNTAFAANGENGLTFPAAGDFPEEVKSSLIYLFTVDEERYFLCGKSEDAETCKAAGFSFMDMKNMRESHMGPKERLFAVYTGKHLADWYRDSAFCGRCGTKMKHSETERAKVCPSCGYTQYPRIMPAVIVGVINQDKILLTRYRAGYNHNALIAGFTEIGETVEETVAREVMEEAGIRVKNIRYYKSQPWGIANDILMGYYCDVDGDPTIHMDGSELKYAEWTLPEDIVLQPDESSLTNEMMKRFKNHISV